ncbi:MAG: hypothetical protein EXS10_03880 [Phycisphaerales bacterium]|nr:hypothetical protein [Phycisphaerales bacterium]
MLPRSLSPSLSVSLLLALVTQTRAEGTREKLREIPEVRAVDGVTKLTLHAKDGLVAVGETTVQTLVYNDTYIPPTIRVSRGERIELTLVNEADENTNVHFHGMQVSPRDYGDSVWTMVPPGHEYTYKIDIPTYHEPGLYWHHAHAHQTSERLVMSGLAGSIIVEGVLEGWPSLASAGLRERHLVLRAMQRSWNGDLTWGIQTSGFPSIRTVNGQSNPEIDIRPGETQLWRVVNQASDHYFNIELGGMPFHIVACDGNPVPAMMTATRYLLAPAARVEILVTGGAVGETALTTRQIRTGPVGDGYSAMTLATLVCAGDANAAPLTLPMDRTADAAKNPLDMRTLSIDNKRDIVFDETDSDFRVNNHVFVGTRIDTSVPFGTVEKWKIINATGELHAFHIHQTDFQVISINGVEQPFTAHLDTANVPAFGSIEILLAFTEPCVLGKFVYHCHILEHEDGGMMASIEVYDPHAPAASVNKQSTDAHDTVRAANPNATGGAFSLTDSADLPRTQSDFTGLTLFTFGYTHCLGACPRTIASYQAVRALLTSDTTPLEFAFVSVDTSRDDALALAAYERESGLPLIAMRGSVEVTAETARTFGAAYEPQPAAADGTYRVKHSTDIYLVGAGGRILERFDLTTEPSVIAASIRQHAHEVPHRVAVVARAVEGGVR